MRELRPDGVRYRIEKCIGQGQTATVYLAIREDSAGHSRHRVALKILKSETAVSWLRREFDALTRVHSPHCVRVLGWENLPEGSALVLDWVDGLSLLELGGQARLDEDLRDEIVAQTQEGLKELDRCGLFHGDLSPANILIDRTGCVRLIDFASDPWDAEEPRGTPAYLAPEIWEGGTGSIAGDLFALGLIEMDLGTSFAGAPDSMAAARERACAMDAGEGLRHRDPALRRFKAVAPCAARRERLASEITRLLRAKEDCVGATRPLMELPSIDVTKRRTAASLAFAVLIMAAPGNAQAPLSREVDEKRAVLVLRSQRWVEIQINGRRMGYAPLEVRDMRPGSHRISWKSSSAAGETRLFLRPGQRRVITDGELVLAAPSR